MPERSKGIEPLPAGAATAASDDAGLAPASSLDWRTDGAALHRGAALSILPQLDAFAAAHPESRAGVRLRSLPPLAPVAAIAARYLGANARPVRAILFDKSPGTNWSLGWHQDRTIVVREQHDTPGFGPWGRKAGLIHVEPPFAIIEAMATLRIHLDDVPADNAPLIIAPGSHRLGRIAEPDIADTVARLGHFACLARRGDIWAYATPILHASAASTGHAHRRVLQIDYAARPLPGELEWLGT